MSDEAATAASADLHCHSSASGPNGNWWYGQLGMADCHTPPEEVYERAKAHGMSFVALTDHDTIDGALELSDPPDVIVGEEVTVCFPDDGKRIDVVVLGLDLSTHRAVQSRRDDAHELVRYLRAEGLVHFLAHPVYDPANAMEPDHLARLRALFALWETRNGTRLPEANALAERLHPDRGTRRSVAAELGLTPAPGAAAGVGGSDDHGGLDIGTTYTVTPPAASVEQFLDHLRAGRCRPGGLHAEPARIAHMMMRLVARRPGSPSDAGEDGPWAAVQQGRTTHRHAARQAERAAGPEQSTQPTASLQGVLDEARRYVHSQSKLLPYLGVQAYLGRERKGARRLADTVEEAGARTPRVALVGDGLDSINGIAETYRNLLAAIGDEAEITPVVCGEASDLPGAVALPAAATFELPVYAGLTLSLPHLSQLGEQLLDLDVDLVHVTAPGPLGLAGMLVAKLLQLPVVAGYHTELGDYAQALTGDPLCAELVQAATRRFYREADLVLAPSACTARRLSDRLEIQPERVAVLPQGVDTDRFSPRHDNGETPRRGARPTVLCVSRLSSEKGLEALVHAMNLRSGEADLVIVGDGPARPALQAVAGDTVAFAGWLEGLELSRAYASADIFVFPSPTETCGQVLLEAQASGLACVVSPHGAGHEGIEPGASGIVAEGNEPEAIAQALDQLLRDPARRTEMGATARKVALRRSWAASAAALGAAYRQLGKRRTEIPAVARPLAALGG